MIELLRQLMIAPAFELSTALLVNMRHTTDFVRRSKLFTQ